MLFLTPDGPPFQERDVPARGDPAGVHRDAVRPAEVQRLLAPVHHGGGEEEEGAAQEAAEEEGHRGGGRAVSDTATWLGILLQTLLCSPLIAICHLHCLDVGNFETSDETPLNTNRVDFSQL